MELKAELDTTKIRAEIERLRKSGRDTRPVMEQMKLHMIEITQEHFREERGPEGPWKQTGRRPARTLRAKEGYRPRTLYLSGRLESSATRPSALTISCTEARLRIKGRAAKYAAIHQYGGTIKPKKKKWLTIPIEASPLKKAEDYKNTFFIRPKASGNLLLAQRMGKRGIKILYLLKKKVRIPARAFLFWEPESVETFAELIKRHLERGTA